MEPSAPLPVAAWMATLDSVNESVRQALGQAEQREQLLIALHSPDEQRATERAAALRDTLDDLSRRLAAFTARCETAGREAATADAAAAALEPVWTRVTATVAGLRDRLAAPPGGP